MITATCHNETCRQNGIGYNFIGTPPQVKCGECHANCDLTDERDDPPIDDEPTV